MQVHITLIAILALTYATAMRLNDYPIQTRGQEIDMDLIKSILEEYSSDSISNYEDDDINLERRQTKGHACKITIRNYYDKNNRKTRLICSKDEDKAHRNNHENDENVCYITLPNGCTQRKINNEDYGCDRLPN